MEETFNFGEEACAIFALGNFTYALSSKSKKTIDTLYKLDTETGSIEEIELRTLAKNSASKLPEVRQDFAWFTTVTMNINDSIISTEGNNASVMREESKRGSVSSQLS